jgi:hypothetical protein
LYQVKLLDRKGYNDSEIGKILSINPYRLKYIRADGKEFDIHELLGTLFKQIMPKKSYEKVKAPFEVEKNDYDNIWNKWLYGIISNWFWYQGFN